MSPGPHSRRCSRKDSAALLVQSEGYGHLLETVGVADQERSTALTVSDDLRQGLQGRGGRVAFGPVRQGNFQHV